MINKPIQKSKYIKACFSLMDTDIVEWIDCNIEGHRRGVRMDKLFLHWYRSTFRHEFKDRKKYAITEFKNKQ